MDLKETVRRYYLTSNFAKKSNPNEIQRTSNFTTKPTTSFFLEKPGDYDYFVGLKTLSCSYSWKNISQEYDNNVILIKKPGRQSFDRLVIHDGLWDYLRLEDYLNREIGVQKDKDNEEVKALEFTFNYAAIRVAVVLRNGTELDIRQGGFRFLIGFDAKVITGAETVGDFTPDITRSIDDVNVTCNLVTQEQDMGPVVDSIFSFATASLDLSYPFEYREVIPTWVRIRSDDISEITIKMVDNDGRELQFMEGINTSVLLMLVRSKKER